MLLSQEGQKKISTDKSWDNYCINSPFVASTATANNKTTRYLKVSLPMNSCCDTLIDVKKKKLKNQFSFPIRIWNWDVGESVTIHIYMELAY